MKVLAVIACVAIFATSYVDAGEEEEKKANILRFFKCLACSDNAEFKDEYAKCEELKSETCKKIVNDCKNKLMPDATTEQARWDTVCNNEHSENEEIYECIMNDERKINLSDDEKAQQEEFLDCMKLVDKKFCDGK